VDDVGYQHCIDSVAVHLIEKFDIDVVFGDGEPNAFWNSSGPPAISINTNQRRRLQLYCLLHEAGHAIIRSKEDYKDLYPYGKKEKNKSISRRVDVVREEVAAWDEGEKLAAHLEIKLDRRLWHNFLKKHLFEYVKWAIDPERFGRDIGRP